MSRIKSIEQARAKFAWTCALGKNKEYGSVVNKVPVYIKTNGLLNTLAFFYSKKNEEILNNIREWLTHAEFGLISSTQVDTNIKLLDYLMSQQEDARFLIQCTSEVLALFNWLRRFAKTS